MKLVIVESPTKAKTLQKFLKKDYQVVSSYGHIRDLPKSKIGIDIENDFKPQYVIESKAKKRAQELKSLAKKADSIILATDPDREGEAISWHLSYILKSDDFDRVAFHEITEKAVKDALNNPRKIDINLVNAQQARRILDRLVGYKLSPLLWKKIIRGLSAGRVQSVALKFIVDREKEIEEFKKEEYWTIDVQFNKDDSKFLAQLVKIDGKKLPKFFLQKKEDAHKIKEELEKERYLISDIKRKDVKKSPLPPFITSTLQQEAYKRLRFSSKLTMRVAQQLYEKGLITYHRTDSYNLSKESINQAQDFIVSNYGQEYWQGPQHKSKKKNIQEAHEAIRPTSLKEVKNLDDRQFKLYQLIWKRFVASLMSSAVMSRLTVEIETKEKKFTLKSSGQTIKFDGFLKVYPIKIEEKTLPELDEGEELSLDKVIDEQHFTQPPARYTEATLIKILEEKGVGRPSTYSPIISVIQERNYIIKDDEKRLCPTEIGRIVSDFLTRHFSNIVDPDFTAHMEKDLDEIATGKKDWASVIKDFYSPFEKKLKEKEKEIDKKEVTEKETDEICDKCNSKMVSKIGRFGRFLACSNYPECKNTKATEEETSEDPCEKCGAPMVLKRSRFGSFWGCSSYPDCKNIKNNDKTLDISCPECKKGQVVVKKSKKGRSFYGCSLYPECKFVSNRKPKKD